MEFKSFVRPYLDFPKPGVMFWDFSPLLSHPAAFASAIQEIAAHFSDQKITKIAAIEAKGFTIGSALAFSMKLPLQLIRKPGLIPGQVDSEKFVKEYGFGEYQLRSHSFSAEDRVLIIYDIMAGPGASRAAIQLVESQGARVIGCSYVVELEYLRGRQELPEYDLFSLVKIAEVPQSN